MKWLCRRCGTPIEGSNNLYCDECLEDDKKIDELEQQGHTSHCACRLVWGDGECECGGNNKNTPEEKRERLKSLYDLVKDA